MRKITLIKLLETHDNAPSAIIKYILNRYFSKISNEQRITFSEILPYLKSEGCLLDFNMDNLKIKKDPELFQLYLTPPLEQNKDKTLNSESISNLEAKREASKFFAPIKHVHFWRDKFLTLYKDLFEDLIEKIQRFIQKNNISNSEKFYQTLCRLLHVPPLTLPPFPHMTNSDLRALSAEIPLIQKLLSERDDFSLMFGAALSGSKDTLAYLTKIFPITDVTTEVDGRNVLHYAAMSGSLETIQFVIQNMKVPVDEQTYHWVAWSGSVASLRYLFEIAPHVELNQEDLLYMAAMGGSAATMEYAFETLKIRPNKDENSVNCLHYAAWSGSIPAINYAINKMHIDPASLDKEGNSVLHYAAISRSPEALRHILKINAEQNLNLSLDLEDERYSEDYWFGGCFKLTNEIKEILQPSRMTLRSQA